MRKYFSQLNVLSRLRNLNEKIVENISIMPITIDIEKDYLYKQGLEQGLEQGEKKGKLEGEQIGEAKTKHDAAINMLKMGMDVQLICQILEVSETYVIDLKKKENI